jgi:hypothetical protein
VYAESIAATSRLEKSQQQAANFPSEAEMPVRLIAHDIGWNTRARQGVVKLLFENQYRADINVSTLSDLAGWAAILASGEVMGDGTWLYTNHHSQLAAKLSSVEGADDFDIPATQ